PWEARYLGPVPAVESFRKGRAAAPGELRQGLGADCQRGTRGVKVARREGRRMKYALIIPDGMADERQEALGGKTPLQAAHTPHCDAVASSGCVGRADHVPASMPSGSDVGTMSLFGYDPLQFHSGRAPLEAAAQGITLGPQDWAVRCNLVTVE